MRFAVNPKLNCAHCYHNKSKFKILPRCETNEGCPIEDIAPVSWVEELINEFYQARMLYEATKVNAVYEKALTNIGLMDDLPLLYALEIAYLEIKKYQNNKELAKQKMLKK